MKEFVGFCTICSKEIYCEQGFLNGVVGDDQFLQCFPCYEKQQIKGNSLE